MFINHHAKYILLNITDFTAPLGNIDYYFFHHTHNNIECFVVVDIPLRLHGTKQNNKKNEMKLHASL